MYLPVVIVPLFSLLYNTSFILFHSHTDGHLVCFFFEGRNNTTVNIFMPVFSVRYVGLSVGYPPKRGFAQSEGLAFFFSSSEGLASVAFCQKVCPNLHFHHQHVKIPVAPHPLQHLVLSAFLKFINPGGWLGSFFF